MNKKILILIFALLIITAVLLSAAFLQGPKNVSAPVSTIPTPTSFQVNTGSQQTKFSQFTQGSTEKMAEKMKNRTSLSDPDQAVKNKLLASLNNNSGVIYKTVDYEIDYLKAPNIFQVQSLVSDMNKTKQESVAWLKSQGFSQEGICNLPIMYLYSQSLAKQMREKGVQFSPLPDGC